MITNLWGRLNIYCGNGHEEEMELKEKRSGMFYECSRCSNSFSIKDIEKLFDKIEDVEREADINNETLDIKNLTLKIGACQYKITENNAEKLKVVAINKKALSYDKKI